MVAGHQRCGGREGCAAGLVPIYFQSTAEIGCFIHLQVVFQRTRGGSPGKGRFGVAGHKVIDRADQGRDV